ncbi:MAG TPA: UDP-N-acetylmuramoyl-L-alanine--D-glutamate ligase [Candidatus Saccharimonadales bacterium]|nr:UDP-N-acetylmuramoyl-L-alanine--D-glutamate ligase [Candidatus Saccharimonadales bacterium]
MKIAIVGWGVETQSAFRYFGPEHEYLIASEEPRDDFPAPTDRVKVQYLKTAREPGLTGNVADLSYLDGIKDYDKIIFSTPAAKNLEKAFKDDKDFWKKATTIQHIFFENVKTKNVIGVTGSKGKGTTSTLIAKMLEAAGKKVFLGGNIGLAVLDFINDVQADDWVVLELANFQLYTLSYSPHIGVCLMITPEHLDWHPDMDDYLRAKSNMFKYQTKDDIAIYFENNEYSKQIVGVSAGRKIPYFEKPGALVGPDGQIVVGEDQTPIISRYDIKLLGEHNLQNICAAVTAVWFSLSKVEGQAKTEAIKKILSSFTGLEHRLELVRELDRVTYYDDSFGTTPDTVQVAIEALIQPVVLILGGHDKGLDYTDLIKEITSKERVRHVITIGRIGPKLAEMLRQRHFTAITEGLQTMPQIVAEARTRAQAGDAVLLSCGTSSFGMFKDYKDRGNQFKAAVKALS